MGNQKLKWTAEEEEALLAGVAKHGPGKWKNILKDPDFAPSLTHRSNIDLKDKWRNLSVNNADKSKTPKIKAASADAPSKACMDDPSNSALDGKNAQRYNEMIFEAISTMKDTNGCDIGAISQFVERKHLVPPTFRRLLSARLRRLVSQGRLEKVQNGYRIRKDALSGTKTATLPGTKTPTPKQNRPRLSHNSGLTSGETGREAATTTKQNRPRVSHNSGLTSGETVKEAARTAAYKVAEAENKSFLAAEAVKESERVLKIAEETDSTLQLVKEIYEQCSRGEIVLLA